MNLSRYFPLLISFLSLTSTTPADYSRVEIDLTSSGAKGSLHLYLFDSRRAELTIIDQGGITEQNHQNLAHAMTAHRCLAGCNGGFFGKDGKPLGLVMSNDQKSGSRNLTSSLTSGVVGQGTGQPFIQRSTTYFKNNPQPHQQLLQSGPFLVENGNRVSGLNTKRHARRTFIFTDGGNRWGIGYAPAITLDSLSKALVNPKTFPHFNIQHALNLDGGPSSGLWVRREHHSFYLRELTPVRNFVGIIPK